MMISLSLSKILGKSYVALRGRNHERKNKIDV